MTGVRMSAGREAEMGTQLPVGVWEGEGRRRGSTSGREGEMVVWREEGVSARFGGGDEGWMAAWTLLLRSAGLGESSGASLCTMSTPQAPPHPQASKVVGQRRD